MRQRRTVRTAAIAVALAAVAAAVPSSAGSDPAPRAGVHVFPVPLDTDPLVNLDLQDDCGPASSTPVPDLQPISVRIPPGPTFVVGQIPASVWRHPWVHDPSWRLHFEGFIYLQPLAARAAVDASVLSLSTMVAQVAAFHQQNPDPGTSAYGWDQGTAQRRLQTENCLYAVTHDPRLIPGIQADVAVQLGPRYDGPPRFPVHNLGLMANLRVLRAGQLLGNADWQDVALARMKRESPLAFTPQGTSWEQSAQYHWINVLLWTAAADQIAKTPGYETTVAAIRGNVARARLVWERMTEPDGRLVQIGDSERRIGDTSVIPVGVFRDDAAGLVIGRSSASRSTTYYTLRYGPPRRAHGHFDRGGITWTTKGARVLIDAGRFGADTTASLTRWQLTPAAANVAFLRNRPFRDYRSARVVRERSHAGGQSWLLDDRLYGVTHLRDISVNDPHHSLVVTDSFSGRVGFSQTWHIDPVWRLVARGHNRLIFKDADGHTLTVGTTGRVSLVLHGSVRPLGGWYFPSMGRALPAYQVTIAATTAKLRTVFTVR